MRALADATRIQQFMKALGREADQCAQVYLTGGATAVLYELLEYFSAIEPRIYRYPAIDPAAFRRAVERAAHA